MQFCQEGKKKKGKKNVCLWTDLSPLCVISLLQVSICTSRPLFIEHISMYS